MEPNPKRLKLNASSVQTTPLQPNQYCNSNTWLDLLPLDLCQKIAVLLPEKNSSDGLLPLAETSPVQSAAVRALLSKSVTFSTKSFVTRWLKILTGELRCVNVTFSAPHRDLAFRLLRLPTIESATICDNEISLSGIANSPSLRYLTIRPSLSPARVDLDYLVFVLNSLRLKSLRFACRGLKCKFHCAASRFDACLDDSKLKKCLSNVQALDIDCVDLPEYFRRIVLPRLLNIQELTMYDEWKEPPYGGLLHVKVLHLRDMHAIRENFAALANPAIRQRLSTVAFRQAYGYFLPQSEIQQLSACSALKELDIPISHGAEMSLLNGFRELRKLRLTWRLRDGTFQSMVGGDYRPVPGCLPAVVKRAPHLTEILLFNVQIQRDEFADILQTVGPRLERLAISETGHGEPSVNRISFVMELLYTYNRNVRDFHIKGNGFEELSSDGSMTRSDFQNLKRQFMILQRRLSLSDCQCLSKLVKKYSPHGKGRPVKFFIRIAAARPLDALERD